MGRTHNLAIHTHLEESGAPTSMDDEVRKGLTSTPKSLPSKYFYDRRGSELFERITRLPEYYLTRAELALLRQHAPEIMRLTRCEDLVELGSGAATKTRTLLDAGLAEKTLRRYVPIEVSEETVELAARALASRYPDLQVHAMIGDFESDLDELPKGGRKLIALLGSTIGNFREPQAARFLLGISDAMADGDWLLLGTDLVKATAVLEAAYNDSEGVTAEFNRNILNVVNEHLGGDFDPGAFEHVATYNAEEARIESYLRATRPQTVRLDTIDLEVTIAKDEMIWTEVSCKYTRESVQSIVGRAGMELRHWFTGDEGEFALSLSCLR